MKLFPLLLGLTWVNCSLLERRLNLLGLVNHLDGGVIETADDVKDAVRVLDKVEHATDMVKVADNVEEATGAVKVAENVVEEATDMVIATDKVEEATDVTKTTDKLDESNTAPVNQAAERDPKSLPETGSGERVHTTPSQNEASTLAKSEDSTTGSCLVKRDGSFLYRRTGTNGCGIQNYQASGHDPVLNFDTRVGDKDITVNTGYGTIYANIKNNDQGKKSPLIAHFKGNDHLYIDWFHGSGYKKGNPKLEELIQIADDIAEKRGVNKMKLMDASHFDVPKNGKWNDGVHSRIKRALEKDPYNDIDKLSPYSKHGYFLSLLTLLVSSLMK